MLSEILFCVSERHSIVVKGGLERDEQEVNKRFFEK